MRIMNVISNVHLKGMIIFPVVLWLIMAGGVARGQCNAQDVVEAAQDGLPLFLRSIPLSSLSIYGFSNETELNATTLGEALEVYTITPEEILHCTAETDISSVISSTSMWLVPVLCSGTVRTFLTVDCSTGRPQAVAIGSSGLARNVETIIRKWPVSEGYQYSMLRVNKAKSEFLLQFRNGKVKIVPLVSAKVALNLGVEDRLCDPFEIMSSLKSIILNSSE